MIRLSEGRDYLFYRVYVWGGLAALVVYSLVMAFSDIPRTGKALHFIFSLPVTVWVLGILVYWWWVFVFKGRIRPGKAITGRTSRAPEISELKNWGTLHTAMAIYGGNPDHMVAADRTSRYPVIIWYLMQNLLVLWILGNYWVWVLFQEHLSADHIKKVWVPGVIVIMILFVGITPILIIRVRRAGISAIIEPLGLSLYESSQVDPSSDSLPDNLNDWISDGVQILDGRRLGRPVHIHTRGRKSYLWVESEVPVLEITSTDGRLEAGNDAPEAVKNVVKALRKARRWKGISVKGDSGGIRIERESRGENWWLYDLWLAEKILEGMKFPGQYT